MTNTLEFPARVGLIGAGAFGRFCVDAYQLASDIDVVAVADPDPTALSMVPGESLRRELDWMRVVEAPDIEAVHIVTPPHVRRPVVEAALAAGKSVFCEKPPALSLTELDAMFATARDHNVVFGADYVMRHHPAYRFLFALAQTDILGKPHTVSFVNLAQAVPEDHWFWDRERSGGIFVEHGIHFFDAYAQILGPPRSVSASLPRRESVLANVDYVSGAVGTYFHEFAYPSVVERAQSILGFDRATLQMDGWIPTRLTGTVLSGTSALHTIAGGMDLTFEATDSGRTTFVANFPNRQLHYEQAIVSGIRDLVRCHRDAAHRLTPTAGEIRDSLALALAARRAADSGASVVLKGRAVQVEDSQRATHLADEPLN